MKTTLAVLLAMLFIVAAGCPATRTPSYTNISSNNLKNLTLALHNYADQTKQFPFAGIDDPEAGVSLRSWRVAILPFIEENARYEQYDFNKPWNSPENLKLAEPMPSIFRSPYEKGKKGTTTSYVVIRGADTAFSSAEGKTFGDFARDGVGNTVAIVEVHDSGIHWMEPRDLIVDDLDFVIRKLSDAKPGQLNTDASNGLLVSLMDGSVRTIPFHAKPELVESLIRLDGKSVEWPD